MPGLAEALEAIASLTTNELRILKQRLDSITLQKDILLHLPEEIRICVLKELDIDDIWTCLNVSSSWRNLMRQDAVVATLSGIHYPGLREMVECRHASQAAESVHERDQDACDILSTLGRQAFVQAVNRNIRRRHGTVSSLFSHRWWLRSNTGLDGAEQLLPADEWRGEFFCRDITQYRLAHTPYPRSAPLRPQTMEKAKYHSGRLAFQFGHEDPRGRFVVDYIEAKVRRRFQPSAQQVGSCELLALGDMLMVCGRGNRLYVYNLLEPEQPCQSLALPGLISKDGAVTAGEHVTGLLSSRESVRAFEWTLGGQLHDYEVLQPPEYALEVCRYLKSSHRPRLVPHPFKKRILYMIFGNIPTDKGLESGKLSLHTKVVVFEIADRKFRARFTTGDLVPAWDSRHDGRPDRHPYSYGAPADSHGSIFLGEFGWVRDDRYIESIVLTFNIFARSFGYSELHENTRRRTCYTRNQHLWEGLFARCSSARFELPHYSAAAKRRLSTPYVVAIRMTSSERKAHKARLDLYYRNVGYQHEIDGNRKTNIRVDFGCFPPSNTGARTAAYEEPRGRDDYNLGEQLEEHINTTASCGQTLYAILSDAEFHTRDYLESADLPGEDNEVLILGDDEYLICIGDAGYAAWCFAPAGEDSK